MRNPYEVLGVTRDADPDVIAAAYRALMRKHHPDVQGDEGRAKEINEAYCILTDPELRRAYEASADREHTQPPVRRASLISEPRRTRNRVVQASLAAALAAGVAYLIWAEPREALRPQARTPQMAPLASSTGAVSIPVEAAAPLTLTRFPEPFRGEWNQRLEDCGTGMNDSRLVISDTMISFYESRGGIHVLQATSAREISGYVSLTGEGEGPWLSKIYFKLSQDGSSIADEAGVVRLRCPSLP